MEENKRNNILDNLDENEKRLYEILGILGELKARINGSIPLGERVKECEISPEQNTIQGKVGKQRGVITDILEEVREIYKYV